MSQLERELKKAKGVTLTSFRGITVSADQELRHSMRSAGVSYSVVKKTLLRRVFEKMGLPTDSFEETDANISIAISPDDEVATARVANNFAKNNETFGIVGGIFEDSWIDEAKVNALAQLPSKDQLIAKTVGTIKAPLSSFVNVLMGNARGLVNVLNAIKESK